MQHALCYIGGLVVEPFVVHINLPCMVQRSWNNLKANLGITLALDVRPALEVVSGYLLPGTLHPSR